ncbi:MAG: hypothetical protein Q4F35_02345 [Akkermansia sp.]|nr:hypothetical protein [Akkermansia sp.]
MNFSALSLLAFSWLPWWQSATPLDLPDVPAAKEQAAREAKPAVIIWYGSDWQPEVDKFCRDWQRQASKYDDHFVFGQFDDKTGLDGAVRKKALPIEHFNIPAIILLAQDGSYMSEFSGDALKKTVEEVMQQIAVLGKKAPRFAELVAKARSGKGAEAVAAAAEALSLLPIKDAMRQRELTTIIDKNDPGDVSGYRSQFCLDHLDMYSEINGLLNGGKTGELRGKDRNFDAAEAYVLRVLGNKVLNGTERRQQWLAGLAYIQRERILSTTTPDNRNLDALLTTLNDIIRLDPDSQYGRGARKFHHYWSPDTFNTVRSDYYTKGDQTLRFEKDWHINVTSSIDGAGTYTFSLEPVQNGRLTTRNFRLVVDGKVIATPGIDEKKDTKSVQFNVPDIPAGATVEVWLTAMCHDHWLESQGFIRMKKN